ncbi:hypothetical protein, conserved [Eimeria brunetti]|uniref:Uncharacterized protein n=1 Tax=Eimeria brunetti TaxID=51314 RepID=U6LQ41_9EIME|nr:hypothetical protein, conserved [Eimeria brunetti]
MKASTFIWSSARHFIHLKYYVLTIAPVGVAALVEEIAHNARMKRRRIEEYRIGSRGPGNPPPPAIACGGGIASAHYFEAAEELDHTALRKERELAASPAAHVATQAHPTEVVSRQATRKTATATEETAPAATKKATAAIEEEMAAASQKRQRQQQQRKQPQQLKRKWQQHPLRKRRHPPQRRRQHLQQRSQQQQQQ